MTTLYRNVATLKKTLIAVTVSLACGSAASAQDDEKFKTISLIKKPISLVKHKKNITTKAKDVIAVNENVYSDIARLLNQLPGVFAVNRLPNDVSPNVTHHNDAVTGQVGLFSDNVIWSPLPFYVSGLKQLTPLFFTQGNVVDAVSTNGFPAVNSSNIIGYTPKVKKVANVKLDIGSNGRHGVVLNHGNENDGFGHYFYAAKQEVDSHREFFNGERGKFESNEIMLKLQEKKAINSGRNKQETQLTIHYKDFNNDESLIGLTDDAEKMPQHRYGATQLDNLAGDELSVVINHETNLLQGEVVTTDIYYRTGSIWSYQTGNVNGLDNIIAPQIFSTFEAAPSGELLIDKQLIDSDYSSVGITMDIEQYLEEHQFNIGVQYYKETLEQTTSTDAFRYNAQLALTKQENDTGSEFQDAKSTIKGVYLKDSWKAGPWIVDFGVKYITVDDYRIFNESLYTRESNNSTAFNLQFNYQLSSTISGFIGGKRGAMAQLGAGTPKLTKTNNQLIAGLHYKSEQGYAALTGYYREFDNVLSRCDSVQTCQLITDDRTDIEISAIEMSAGYVGEFATWTLPINFNYTHRKSQYSDVASSIKYSISPNDDLLHLPEQQFSINMGAQFQHFYIGTRIQYRGEQRTTLGQDMLDQTNSIDAVTLVDFTVNYRLSNKHSISLALENALDKQYVEHSYYRGKMMGRNRFVTLSYKFNF